MLSDYMSLNGCISSDDAVLNGENVRGVKSSGIKVGIVKRSVVVKEKGAILEDPAVYFDRMWKVKVLVLACGIIHNDRITPL